MDWLEQLETIVKTLKFIGPKMNQRTCARAADARLE